MVENVDSFPALYILMRSDLASMTNGKSSAQASHASNAFVKHMTDSFEDDVQNTSTQDLFNEWQASTLQGFGTVLVLQVNEAEMRTAAAVAKSLGFVSGIIHDPTYPLRDGEVCHSLPIDTCAYVFGDKDDPMLKAVVGKFEMHY